jgi:hypothetical protein
MPLYLEATVRPEGEQAENIETLLADLGELPLIGSVGDPGDLIITQLEAQAAEASVDFSYAEDVEPWLGEKAGFGISEVEGETRFVLAIETTDEDAARESLDSLLSEDEVPYEEGEYEGASYFESPDESFRVGVFDGFLVLAPSADFEAAVDASSGDSLGAADKFADATANLEDDRLASFYFDLAGFAEVADPEDVEDLETAQAVVPEIFDGSIAVSAGLSASDQIYIDSSVPLFEGQPELGATPLLEAAAGDAFGAAGFEDLGAYLPPIADLFDRANEAGAELEDFPEEGLAAAFEDETGVSLEAAAEALGDGNAWIRGELPDAVEIAGEIEVSDTETATALIEAIEREVETEGSGKVGPPVGGSDVGFSVTEENTQVADAGDFECSSVGDVAECLPTSSAQAKLPFVNVELDGEVIRYGFFTDKEAAAASDPDSGGDFGETETFATGQEALGDEFEFLGALDVGAIFDQAIGGPGVDDVVAGPAELALPFLGDKLGVLATGVRYEDDSAIQRYVLKLAE